MLHAIIKDTNIYIMLTLSSVVSSLKGKIKTMEEVAMRRERRLTFLTKERDGYINVLKSYQLDSTVDQQIKELQAEVFINMLVLFNNV